MKTNIIYFCVHDIGRHIEPYGVPVATPSLMKLAADGLVFDTAFCGSPPCSPSRGCVMTGRSAHSNGLMGLTNKGWSMPVEEQTIVDYFNAAGYETAHAGFQHERVPDEANRYQKELSPEPQPVCRFVENVVDAGIAYLEERGEDAPPFYLNLASQECHASFWAPGCWTDRTDVYGIDLVEDAHVPAHMPDNPKSRQMMARFQCAIRYMDAQVGRLFEAIDRLGYRDNTLVVFTTDHGIVGSRAKGTCYDRGTETALVMRLPGGAKGGTRCSELISNIDLLPTFLELCDVPIPERVEGRSFAPLLTGREYRPNEFVFTERNYHEGYDPVRSVRGKRFHYIRNYDAEAKRFLTPAEILNAPREEWREGWPNAAIENGVVSGNAAPEGVYPFEPRPAEELYDTEADPEEWVNLAGQPDHAEIQQQLADELAAWMRRTNDPILKAPIPDCLHPWPAGEAYTEGEKVAQDSPS